LAKEFGVVLSGDAGQPEFKITDLRQDVADLPQAARMRSYQSKAGHRTI
jgi:hypothetical protein